MPSAKIPRILSGTSTTIMGMPAVSSRFTEMNYVTATPSRNGLFGMDEIRRR